MSDSASDRQPDRTTASGDADGRGTDELRAELARLADENERLRQAYARSKRVAYRRSAAILAGLGLVAVAGGLVLPATRSVLFVLGAIGLFGAVLTAYLTPERFVAASVGRAVYGALADNEAALAAELGLADAHYYVPTGPGRGVRLYVPQAGTEGMPTPADLETTLVATDEAVGLALDPSGADLLREFEASLSGDLADTPATLAGQLAEALTEQFELVTHAAPDVDDENRRVTIAVGGSAYGRADRFDHPVPSFIAAGFARGLGRPISLEVADGDDEWLITCRWGPEAATPGQSSPIEDATPEPEAPSDLQSEPEGQSESQSQSSSAAASPSEPAGPSDSEAAERSSAASQPAADDTTTAAGADAVEELSTVEDANGGAGAESTAGDESTARGNRTED